MCRIVLALLLLLSVASCGGGGGGDSSLDPTDLVLLDVNVAGRDGVPLNEVIVFRFSVPIDPASVRPDTIRIRESGERGRQVPGDFRVGDTGTEGDGQTVLFYPRIPERPDLSDAGLEPGTLYEILLPAVPDEATTVHDHAGDPLVAGARATFRTAEVGRLFTDNFPDPGPPRLRFANPADGTREVAADAPITLSFNRRPLHPATLTPASVRLTLLSRAGRSTPRPVEGEPVLEQSRHAVLLRFVPRFPLADVATYRLEVDHTVTDLAGEPIEPVRIDFTVRDEPTREATFVLEFDAEEAEARVDPDTTNASWDGVVPGALAAVPAEIGGTGRSGDLIAEADLALSPEAVPGVEVLEQHGTEYAVYNFRRVEIAKGAVVRIRAGKSGLPVIVRSLGPIRIEGTLSVAGDPGEDGEDYPGYTYRRNPSKAGGAAGPGGGNGAASYAGGAYESVPIANGADAPGGAEGGRGGTAGAEVTSTYHRSNGGGGGGGGARESGEGGRDANYSTADANGTGGAGGRAEPANPERIPATGGAGGGAGGLGFNYKSGSVQIHRPGGAGGGGGGGMTLSCLGALLLGREGKILAAGGDGGGTGRGSSGFHGGAGGGGGGGTVKIAATGGIVLAPDAEIDVSGGAGGRWQANSSTYAGATGGRGGDGHLRFEVPDGARAEGIAGADLTGAPSMGSLRLARPETLSAGQTRFEDLGVFDPVLREFEVVATPWNDDIEIEVQMAVEDPDDPTSPRLAPGTVLDVLDSDGDGETDDTLDPGSLSEWTPLANLPTLNGKGYRFLRVRVRFHLDPGHRLADPMPYVERLTITYEF